MSSSTKERHLKWVRMTHLRCKIKMYKIKMFTSRNRCGVHGAWHQWLRVKTKSATHVVDLSLTTSYCSSFDSWLYNLQIAHVKECRASNNKLMSPSNQWIHVRARQRVTSLIPACYMVSVFIWETWDAGCVFCHAVSSSSSDKQYLVTVPVSSQSAVLNI